MPDTALEEITFEVRIRLGRDLEDAPHEQEPIDQETVARQIELILLSEKINTTQSGAVFLGQLLQVDDVEVAPC